MKFVATVLLACVAVSIAQEHSFEDCLKQDSISCLQKTIYRKAKSFFERDSFDLVSGISLVKSTQDRQSRSGKMLAYDQEIEAPKVGVQQRQQALENFVGEEAKDFISGRSLKINFKPALDKITETARSIKDSIPQEIEEAATQIAEGRLRKNKIKSILPLILLAKAKVGIVATLLFLGLALIIKKAIVVSLISIALSSFLGFRGFFGLGNKWAPVSAWQPNIAPQISAYPPAASNAWSASTNQATWDDGHSASLSANSPTYTGYH